MVATSTAAESLLAEVRAILPLVRAGGDQGERERRLPRHVADAMAEIGICRILAPRAIGGLQLDPLTYLDIIEALSHAEGSAGWCAQVYTASSHLSGFLAPEVTHGRPKTSASRVVLRRRA